MMTLLNGLCLLLLPQLSARIQKVVCHLGNREFEWLFFAPDIKCSGFAILKQFYFSVNSFILSAN